MITILTYFQNHKKGIIFGLISILSIILSLSLLLRYSKLNLNNLQATSLESIQTEPTKIIEYSSECNLPKSDASKTEVRNQMTALFACSVQSHLEKYKQKSIILEDAKSQNELIKLLFESDKLENSQLMYDSGNWQIYFWSQYKDQAAKTENFVIHSDITSPQKQANRKMDAQGQKAAPSREMILKQPEIVLKVGDKYEALNYKHILSLTGFTSEEQILDFVLIHHKLLGQNEGDLGVKDGEVQFDIEIKRLTPLLFLNNYQFSNQNDTGSLRFGCGKNYEANLKTQIDLNKQEIQYFSHPNGNSLAKVKLLLEGNDLKYEIQNELICDNMVNC